MSILPEYAVPTGIRAMLYEMAEVLLRYPDEAQRRRRRVAAHAESFSSRSPRP